MIIKTHVKESFKTYWQGKFVWGNKLCRYYHAITMVSNFLGVDIDDKAQLDFYNSLIERKKLHGGNKKEGIDTVVNRANRYYNKSMKVSKLEAFTKRWRTMLDRGHGVSMSISCREDFLEDYKDGKIDNISIMTKSIGGHAISIHKIDGEYCFTNTRKSNNIVIIPKDMMEKLGVWQSRESFYIYD